MNLLNRHKVVFWLLSSIVASLGFGQGTLHVTGTGGGFETGIIIDNPVSIPWTITLVGTYPDGTTVESIQTLPGYGRFVGSAQHLFPDRMDGNGNTLRVSHIRVPTSIMFVTATYLRSGSTPTTVEPVPDGTQWIIRPSDPSHTDGIAFVNTDSMPVNVVVEYVNKDGVVIKTETIATDLGPGGKVLHILDRTEDTAYYRIKSTGTGGTISLSFSNDGNVIEENPADVIDEQSPTEEELENEQGCLQLETEHYAFKLSHGNEFQLVSGASSGAISFGEYQVISSLNNVTLVQLMHQGGPAIDGDLLTLIWQSYWGGRVALSQSTQPEGPRDYLPFDRESGGCKSR